MALLIPPDRYFQDSPQWFSQLDGQRSPRGQLCLTNEDLRRELVQNLKERLYQNPEATLASSELIREFLAGYYGPAASHLQAYLDLLHDTVEKTDDWLGCYSPPDAKFLSLDLLRQSLAHLQAAEEAVREDPDLRQRVRGAQLPVWYVFLIRWDELREKAQVTQADWPLPDSIQTVLGWFKEVATQKKITRLSETTQGFGPLEQAGQRAQK